MKDVPAGWAVARANRYSAVAIVLHWLIAAAIVLQVALASRMEGPASPQVFAVIQLHKSVGITVLWLSLVRLGWRLAHPPPPETYPLARWERLLSRVVHLGFYVAMIGLPITGWVMVSTSKIPIPTLLYGVVPWPHIPWLEGLQGGARHAWREFGEEGHEALVKGAFLLLALHVAGVLKHQLLRPGEPVLARMAPGAVAGRLMEPRLLLIALGAVGVAVFGRMVVPPAARAPAPAVSEADAASEIPEAAEAERAAAPAAVAEPAKTEPAARAAAEPLRWAIAPGSRLDFETTWDGAPIEGRFGRWSGDILFSPDALEASRVTIRIDLASADTGDPQRDEILPSSDWFDVGSHPQAVFVAERFAARGDDRFVAHGRLTLRGVSRPVDLPFRLQIDGDKARVRGVTTLDRTAFGVGQGEWTSTDQIPAAVKVSVDLRATRR